MSESSQAKAALLLIDFQKDFLSLDGRLPVAQHQAPAVLDAARQAIVEFQSVGSPIVAIGNEFRRGDVLNLFRRFASIAGSPGAAWDERLPVDGVQYFPKSGGSAFGNPELEPWLRARGVTQLVLTGLQAKACVTATAKDAIKRGFRVSTFDAAVACMSDKSRAKALARLHTAGVTLWQPQFSDTSQTYQV